MRIAKLSVLALSILPALHAASIYGWGVAGDSGCVQVGNTCTLDGFEMIYDYYPSPIHAWITEETGDGSATVKGESDMRMGESMYGFSEFAGAHTMIGGSGYGFAQFQLSWNVNIIGAWGNVQVTGPGINEWLTPSNYAETGSAWSDPIPMLWGEPLSYSFSVAGGLDNMPGDCCGGFDITARVTDWRFWEPPVDTAIIPAASTPEPGTGILALLGGALVAAGRIKLRRP